VLFAILSSQKKVPMSFPSPIQQRSNPIPIPQKKSSTKRELNEQSPLDRIDAILNRTPLTSEQVAQAEKMLNKVKKEESYSISPKPFSFSLHLAEQRILSAKEIIKVK
jgi:hypothetical protein